MSSLGPEREKEPKAQDTGFADHVERRYHAIERRTFAHADDVQKAEPDDEPEYDAEVQPRVNRVYECGHQLAGIVHGGPGKERHVNGEVEQHRPSRDEAEDIAEPAHDEILPAAGHWIRRRELRVSQSDADVHHAGEQKGNVRGSGSPREYQAQPDEDVGADVGIAPGEGAPGRYAAAQLGWGLLESAGTRTRFDAGSSVFRPA